MIIKMKFLPTLVLFALLNILVADELEEEYKKEVYITTHLMTAVKNIVLGEYTMVEMALMLGVPEKQDLVVIEQETQENLGYNDDKTSPLLAVTEQQVAVIVHEKLLSYQKKVQSEIETATGVDNAPAIDEGSLRRTNLENLGNERRCITTAAVNRLIDAVFVRQNSDLVSAFSRFFQLCRLLGLGRSLRNLLKELPIIKSANVHNEICTLEDLDENQTKYRLFYDNNHRVQFQKLSF